MSKETGGAAFPLLMGSETIEGCEGMQLRDYFAAAALKGLCGNSGGPFQSNSMSGWALVNCEVDDVANESYQLADAMLRARGQ